MSRTSPTPALSESATAIYESLSGRHSSHSLTQDRAEVLEDLQERCGQCREPNWDGHGASAASIDSYLASRRAIRALPTSIPDPDVDVTPQGKFLLEWYRGPRQVLSMTISDTGEVKYALLLGRNKQTGSSLFADAFPEDVLHAIRRLYR